jgi:hypothetical protein
VSHLMVKKLIIIIIDIYNFLSIIDSIRGNRSLRSHLYAIDARGNFSFCAGALRSPARQLDLNIYIRSKANRCKPLAESPTEWKNITAALILEPS